MLNKGLYPFWFWNGELSEDEIRWQIYQMSEQGISGFFIHNRQGLQTPYMSELFFRMVDVAIDQAEKLGLIVHLYDEYPYPSGVAGGEVVMGQPKFFATRLLQESYDISGGHVQKELPCGKILHCMAYPLCDGVVNWSAGIDLRSHVGMLLCDQSYREGSDLKAYNRKRFFASNPKPVLETSLPVGSYRLWCSVQTVVDRHKYWGNFIDELNPQAVQEFIRCTHERYRSRFGDRFGSLIYSIFTDEITAHWSDNIPDAFLDKYGYDLLPVLPALMEPAHDRHAQITYDFQQLLYEKFCDSFEEPIRNWCHQAGIKFVGEKPSFRMSQLRYMDIPGCDVAHTKAGCKHLDLLQPEPRYNARVAASAAYWYGKEGSLCECFHSLGWGGTLQDARWLIDGLTLLGIKHFVPHGAFYSAHSLKKHDAPPSFFFQMPFWEQFGLLSSRVERLGEYFGTSYPHAEVLVYEPSSGVPDAEMQSAYEELLYKLMAEHIDYLMVDTDILESGTLEDGGRLHVRDIIASVVLLPPMCLVEPSLKNWLDHFSDAGGQVVTCNSKGDIPIVLQEICKKVKPRLRMKSLAGDISKLWRAAREYEGYQGWLFLNTSAETMEISLDAGMPLAERPLDSTLPVMLEAVGDKTEYQRHVEPFEAFWIETAEEKAQPADVLKQICISTDGCWKLYRKAENVLRLYNWEMSLNVPGAECPNHSAKVSAVPLSNQLEQGGFTFEPVVKRYFGSMPQMQLPRFALEYKRSFALDYDGPVHLVLERDSIVGDWKIIVNEKSLLREEDFSETNLHMRGCVSSDITNLLRQGENEITVCVQTDRADGGLCNALYLAGDFGVTQDSESPLCRIVPAIAEGKFEAYRANALPFYSGVLDYERDIELTDIPDTETVLLRLDTGNLFEEACAISLNGNKWLPLPWSPRLCSAPTSMLHNGSNNVRIRVFTTRIRSFEGQRFDPVLHECRCVWEE